MDKKKKIREGKSVIEDSINLQSILNLIINYRQDSSMRNL